MALPEVYVPEYMTDLKARVENLSIEELRRFPSLTSDDYEMMGRYAQSYNLIDLELLRALSIFHAENKLPEELQKKYPRFQAAQLVDHVIAALTHIRLSEIELSEVISKLNIVSYGRGFRNVICHWVGKRFPGEDVFVFATKDDGDAKRAFGRSLAPLNIQTSVVGRSEFRRLTTEVGEISGWLSQQIPVWYNLSIC